MIKDKSGNALTYDNPLVINMSELKNKDFNVKDYIDYSSTDDVDGNITEGVEVTHYVDKTKPGLYVISFVTRDSLYGFTGLSQNHIVWEDVRVQLVDDIIPELSYEITGKETADKLNGWYKDSIVVTLNGTDNESGIDYYGYKLTIGETTTTVEKHTINDVVSNIITIDTPSDNINLVVWAVDKSGNKSAETPINNLKLDTDNPTITEVKPFTTKVGENGWYQANIGLDITASDNGSDVTDICYNISYDGGKTWENETEDICESTTTNKIQVPNLITKESSNIVYKAYAKDLVGHQTIENKTNTDKPLMLDLNDPIIEINTDGLTEVVKGKEYSIELDATKDGLYNIPAPINTYDLFAGTRKEINYSIVLAGPTDPSNSNLEVVMPEFPTNKFAIKLDNIVNGAFNYIVTDDSGRSSSIKINVNIKDDKGPEFEYDGETTIEVPFGSKYDIPVIKACDLKDGCKDITGKGTVDTNVAGYYKVTYTATDNNNHSKTLELTIKVQSIDATDLLNNTLEKLVDTTNNIKYVTKGNNYIWYSGHLWRAYRINNDGTIKLITEESAAGIAYDDESTNYSTSHAYEWLNTKFYNALNNTNIIVKESAYCNELSTNSKTARTTCNNSVTANVGLITYDEYNLIGGAKSYLANGDRFYTMTPLGKRNLWVIGPDGNYAYVNNNGKTSFTTVSEPYAIRPVITIYDTVKINSGNGTKSNPYHLEGDEVSTKDLNKHITGEYVSFAGHTWRIVDTDNNGTRLIYDGLYVSDGKIATNTYGTFKTLSNDKGIGSILYNEIYNGMLKKHQSALSKYNWVSTEYHLGMNPMKATSTEVANTYVGLINVGELMSGGSSTTKETTSKVLGNEITGISTSGIDNISSWTLTHDGKKNWYITNTGVSDIMTSEEISLAIRPVIYINNSTTIERGNGTYTSPYELNAN